MWPSTERITPPVPELNSVPSRGVEPPPPLYRVSGRAPVGLYIHQLWRARHFIRTQAFARAVTRHEGMLLGNLWLVFAPLLDALGYYLLFAVILKIDRGIPNFPAFLATGIFLFSYTSRCVSSSAGLIRGNRGLIRAFNFPRMTLPIAAIVREAMNMVPTLLVLAIFVVVIPPHAKPTLLWVMLPVVLTLQTIMNLGLALVIARVTHWFPDVKHLIGFVTRFWMYFSGVMFSLQRFVDQPTILAVMQANPAYMVLDMSRQLLLYDTQPDVTEWGKLAAWAFGLLTIGFFYFWAGETTYGRER